FVEKKRGEMEAAEVKSDDPTAMEAHYKALADLKAEEYRIDERLTELEPQCEAIRMTEADLADVIEIWTGVPASTITESEYTRLAELELRLKKRIIGQDEAVNAVSRAIRRNRAGVSYKRKPVSFIFAGPTGVGKTELVKVLAEDLFSTPDALIRVDMSEFMEKYSVSRIIGSAPGYVGYDDAGQLTEKIRRRPYSVVLFDEIEKAHPDVMNILLQILDDGIITDSHGKQVDFSNTVIVMTTNAGSSTGSRSAGFIVNADAAAADRTKKALDDFLRPEFLNRVDEIIHFRHLTKEDFTYIARIMLGDLAGQLEKKGISVVFREGAYAYVAEKSFSETYGARNMRRLIQKEIEDPIAGEIIAKKGAVSAISVDAGADGITLVSL
ncbi:MAG: ATP-dependent Clp protease ATP-binding subunit, partial [Clostridia bacterium]|nr:ATP-dependent Clp protease ATP-binding subunit [Clostridia bacterium]